MCFIGLQAAKDASIGLLGLPTLHVRTRLEVPLLIDKY